MTRRSLPIDGHGVRLPPSDGTGLRRDRPPIAPPSTPRLDLDFHAVLGAQTADDHVELQRADDADDRLAAAGRDEEHLHQALFLELPQPLVELLVAGVLQPDAAEVLGRKTRDAGKLAPARRCAACRRSRTGRG